MFFPLSKLFWALVQPSNLLVIFMMLAAIALALNWHVLARRLLAALACATLAITFLPIGQWLMAPMEHRFPEIADLPDEIDGIIVLGGAVDVGVMEGHGQLALNDQAERLTAFLDLARRYPSARLVYSDGIGSIVRPDVDIATQVAAFFRDHGLDPERVVFEDRSRNTAENAALSKELVNPSPDERWLLVTSAFHMPRAVGIFRRLDWQVIAYPVDYKHAASTTWHAWTSSIVQPDVARRLGDLDVAVRAYIGLLAYWLTDRTNELFPAP